MFLCFHSTWLLNLNFGASNDYLRVFEAPEMVRQVLLNPSKCLKSCHGFKGSLHAQDPLENVLLQCDIVTAKLRGSCLIESPVRKCTSTI